MKFIISNSGARYTIESFNEESPDEGVFVGLAPVDLELYLGHEVKITGEFGYGKGSEIQCLPNREEDCFDEFNAVVFNIESIKIVD